jgi:glycosyltransferase involved in cell wall biosynthesis
MPHTTTHPDYCHCAYTAKVYKALRMFSRRGHTCIDYSNEGALVKSGVTHVDIFTEAERASYFGPHDKQKLYHIIWDPGQPYWLEYNKRLVEALKPRVKPGDFILTLSGCCQVFAVGDHFPGSYFGTQTGPALVEWGIGYYGVASRYRIFESQFHRAWVFGRADVKNDDNDAAVVHNFFDMDEFPVNPPISPRVAGAINDRPYYLFLGRVINDKGLDIVLDTIKAIPESRLIIAGQGEFTPPSDNVVMFGHANVEERAALMTNAIAMLNPTHFQEPFGGTAVEGQLCGTPVITTDHGAFCETVEDRWRCASHREFVEAAKRAAVLSPGERLAIRLAAQRRWSLEAIAPRYERYFGRIFSRFGAGWYEMRDLEMLEPAVPQTLAEKFALIHQRNLWGGVGTVSGIGSQLDSTVVIRAALPELLKRLGIRSILDAPCGDRVWIRAAGLDVEYFGADIVPELVNDQGPNLSLADITCDPLPKADLILCRDGLVHLSFENVKRAVQNFAASGATWLLTTTFPAHDNSEIQDGDWRPLNFTKVPFGWGPPQETIVEGCTSDGGVYTDKSLGLWRLSDVVPLNKSRRPEV